MNKTLRVVLGVGAATMLCPLVGGATERNNAMKSPTVTVKSAHKPDAGKLQFTVEIVNNTDAALVITTSARNPPFRVQAIDEKGLCITLYQYPPTVKNGKTRNTQLAFKPRESKTYPVTIADYKDENGNTHKVPSGTYRVIVLLSVVSRVDGKYEVETRKSPPVRITVK